MLSPRRFPLLALVLIVQLALAASVTASGTPSAASGPASDYIVVLKRSANTDTEASALERRFGFASTLRYHFALKGFAARLTPAQVSLLSRLPIVDYIEPDGVATIADSVPLVSGETAPTGVRRIGAATSTVASPASGVRVAVIDTGVQLNHPDLTVVNGRNCVSWWSSSANDDNGHGTHVAGTIAARNASKTGTNVVGVAPGTTIVAVKVLSSSGSGSWSQVICGIDWVTQNAASQNIKVANMSLGGAGTNASLCNAIANSTSAGVTYVVAAGNNNADLAGYTPANCPQVLAVTAVTDSDGQGGGTGGQPSCRSGEADDRYASFSNFAVNTADQGRTIAAPGTCILSTWLNGGYNTISGTSMATPHVAGVAALCISQGSSAGPCAGMTPSQVAARLRADAADRAASTPSYRFSGDPYSPVSGRSYGNMVVGDYALGTTVTPPPTPDFTLSASPTSRTVTQGSDAVYTITINRSGGHTAAVDLSVTGLPAGAAASFSPDPTTGGSSTLTVVTTGSATGGPVNLTVQGTDGSINRSVSVSLTVNAPPSGNPDFTLSAAPTSQSVRRGTAVNYTITVNPTGGFAGAVTFSVSGLGLGMGGSFNPTSSTTSTTLRVTSNSFWSPRGTRTLTITGTGGGLSRTVQVTLTLT